MKSGVVLCPIDFSSSRSAMTEAATGERLVLAHVVALQAQLDARRGDAVAAGAREVDTRLLHGAPWDRIDALARELSARLIVMGTPGRTGLRHVLLGSVAEKVARHAPCSMLVTHAPEAAS